MIRTRDPLGYIFNKAFNLSVQFLARATASAPLCAGPLLEVPAQRRAQIKEVQRFTISLNAGEMRPVFKVFRGGKRYCTPRRISRFALHEKLMPHLAQSSGSVNQMELAKLVFKSYNLCI